MRLRKMCRWVLSGLMTVLGLLSASAAQRVWDGGGADDNLSTAANWEGDVAPISGDILVFRGNVRTSPVNDFDPETTVFETLVFSNNSQTTELSASFTLSGNKIVLTGGTSFNDAGQKGYAIFVSQAQASKELTDTLNLEVSLPNNSRETSRFGGFGMSYHHLVFKQAVTADGGPLYSAPQMRGNLTFEGPVSGVSRVLRPNGGGRIWLRSSENVFTQENPTHELKEGSLRVDSVAACGGSGTSFKFGQPNYNTPGKLILNIPEDSLFTGAIQVNGANYRTGAGQLLNEVAGTTAVFTGNITASVGHSAYGDSDGLGTGITLGSAGDGILAGDLQSTPVWVYKQGAGTWTLAGQSSSTGAVTVSAGTLLVNGDYSTAERSQVAANARLGGTGSLGDVSFAGNSRLAVTNLVNGTALHVNAVTVPGVVVVDLLDPIVPGQGSHTVLTFASRNGAGSFTLGTGWPEGTTFVLEENELTATIPSSVLTWTGGVSSAWDFTTVNWVGGLFVDGAAVVFGDAGEQTNVTIPQEVRPNSVLVFGTKDYTFTGSAIAGTCSVEKNGSGTLVFANANTYAGGTSINAGNFRLEGSLADTTVLIGSNATFTNTTSSRIMGFGAVVCEGMMELNGTNDFIGGLTLKGSSVITDPRAMGAGDVTLGGTKITRLTGGGEGVGRGRTLTTEYIDDSESHYLEVSGGAFTWLGNVRIRNKRMYVRPKSGASIVFGEPGCDTTVVTEGIGGTDVGGFYLRENGSVHFYSRLDLGNSGLWQTDYNAIHLYAPGNVWNMLRIPVGTVYCHTNNALAWAQVRMGQTWYENRFNPILDLGGFDQTITSLVMNDAIETSTETIKSVKPATLTVSNDVNTTTVRMQCRITGAITLRKEGTGTWTFGAQNQTTGNVEVARGTLKLTASDTLPSGTESTLTIAAGAQVVLDEGVQASIAYAFCDGHPLKAGIYCGEGGTGQRLDTFFGAGAGSLTVTRGVNGLAIIFR